MTPGQKQVLDFVRAHHEKHGRSPTMVAICDALGIKSKGNVAARLKALVEYGFLRRGPDYSGKYIPVEATCGGLANYSTADLLAELQRRETPADRGGKS